MWAKNRENSPDWLDIYQGRLIASGSHVQRLLEEEIKIDQFWICQFAAKFIRKGQCLFMIGTEKLYVTILGSLWKYI